MTADVESFQTLTIVCRIPSELQQQLDVLWCNPDLLEHSGFIGISPGDDFASYFTDSAHLDMLMSHVSSRLYVQSTYRLEIANELWSVDVVMRDVLIFILDRASETGDERGTELARLSSELDLGQQILDLLPNPVFVKDRAHRWILGNQAFWELIGKKAIGASDYDLFPKEQADIFWEKDEQVIQSRMAVGNEEQITSRDGSIRWLWTVKTPLQMVDGSMGLVGVITDITRRKMAEEQLLQNVNLRDEALANSQSKSRFLTSMSHELRTPLNAIMGYTELLLEEIEDDVTAPGEFYQDDLKKIHKATYHLLNLINDVLDLSRVESGDFKIEVKTFEVEPVVLECFEILARSCKPGHRFVYQDLSDWHTPQHIKLDRARLKQVLLNLLANAVKFTQQGEIGVSVASCDAHTITLHVWDQGDGVATDHQHEIFRPFERLSYENSSTLGTGLGLGLSRYICRMMGGELDIAPHVEGEGATFIARLPRELDEEDQWASVSAVEQFAHQLQGMNEHTHEDVLLLSNHANMSHEMLRAFSDGLPVQIIVCTSLTQVMSYRSETRRTRLVLEQDVVKELDGDELFEQLLTREASDESHQLDVLYYGRDAQDLAVSVYDRYGVKVTALPFPLTRHEWRTILSDA